MFTEKKGYPLFLSVPLYNNVSNSHEKLKIHQELRYFKERFGCTHSFRQDTPYNYHGHPLHCDFASCFVQKRRVVGMSWEYNAVMPVFGDEIAVAF